MGKNTDNKIIMVNSFKGGTGKTSVALANCVHNCTQNKFYKNIFLLILTDWVQACLMHYFQMK